MLSEIQHFSEVFNGDIFPAVNQEEEIECLGDGKLDMGENGIGCDPLNIITS